MTTLEQTPAPDALAASAAAERPVLATITYRGEDYNVVRKPSVLLLSELARTSTSDSAEALGVVADFFETVLGPDYRRFRKAALASDDDVETDELLPLIGDVVEKTTGRPTA